MSPSADGDDPTESGSWTSALSLANTWDSDYPATMVHLPSGLRVGVCAYSDRAEAFTRFPAGAEGVKLGRRHLDGQYAELELSHEDTVLDVYFARSDPATVCGGWRARRTGEWGLRFWVIVTWELCRATPLGWSYERENGLLRGRRRMPGEYGARGADRTCGACLARR